VKTESTHSIDDASHTFRIDASHLRDRRRRKRKGWESSPIFSRSSLLSRSFSPSLSFSGDEDKAAQLGVARRLKSITVGGCHPFAPQGIHLLHDLLMIRFDPKWSVTLSDDEIVEICEQTPKLLLLGCFFRHRPNAVDGCSSTDMVVGSSSSKAKSTR